MNTQFANLFSRPPMKTEDGIYFYDADRDGDCFFDDDVQSWQAGRFDRNWNEPQLLENQAVRFLLEQMAQRKSPVVDVACGPGMGLIPSLKKLSPTHICLASDASSWVITEWQKFFAAHIASNPESRPAMESVSFAQFSVMDIPFQDNAVPAYSSFIGISSTRSGNAGKEKALGEIYRTLCHGGYFYTIENEWTNVAAIPKLFAMMGKEPWQCFREPQISWHDCFLHAGFEIEYEKTVRHMALTKDDNELGEAAEKAGVEIGVSETAFIAKKSL